jgi:hypothetical protein
METNDRVRHLQQHSPGHCIRCVDPDSGGAVHRYFIDKKVQVAIFRIQELDDESREKRENRRYLKIKFLVSLGLLSIVCVSVTAFLMFT